MVYLEYPFTDELFKNLLKVGLKVKIGLKLHSLPIHFGNDVVIGYRSGTKNCFELLHLEKELTTSLSQCLIGFAK